MLKNRGPNIEPCGIPVLIPMIQDSRIEHIESD